MARVDLKDPTGRTPEAWTFVADGDPLDGVFYPVVSLARFRDEQAALQDRIPSVGVRLDNDVAISEVVDLAAHVDRIELVFPVFKDGRAFTQARRLRRDAGFSGELRATGHIIPDQASFLRRCGFSSVDISDVRAPALIQHLSAFSVVYQDAADDLPTAMERRHQNRDDVIRRVTS